MLEQVRTYTCDIEGCTNTAQGVFPSTWVQFWKLEFERFVHICEICVRELGQRDRLGDADK